MFVSLPQDDRSNERASQLAASRETWQFAYDWPIGVATTADLPKEDEFSASYIVKSTTTYLEIGANLAEMALDGWERGQLLSMLKERFEGTSHATFKDAVFSTPTELAASIPHKRPQSWDEYEHLYEVWDAPDVIKCFHDGEAAADMAFAWQRCGGCNPMVLARCDALPAHFALDEATYQRNISGDTLAQAIAEKRLFLADYAALDGIEAGVTDGITKYITAPIAAFVAEKGTGTLRPVAIQTGQTTDQPLVTPLDGWHWWMARCQVQIADANMHEGFAHLGRTHMVMEAVQLAMHRELAEKHPLYVLLVAHTDTTSAINHSAKTSLIAPGGVVDRCFAPTIEAFGKVVKLAVDSYDLATTAPRDDLATRGLLDTDILPEHPYRDDALPLWDALETFIGEYVGLYYKSDADVLADAEVQAFACTLGAEDGGRLHGVPPAGTVAELTFLLTRLIWIAGPQHSAVNFPQFPNMGFPTNMPGASYAPPFDKDTPNTEEAFVDMLPAWRVAIEDATMIYLLSNVRVSKLGHYGALHFLDPFVLPVVHRFHKALDALEKQTEARNVKRFLPYPYLTPSLVLQSISI